MPLMKGVAQAACLSILHSRINAYFDFKINHNFLWTAEGFLSKIGEQNRKLQICEIFELILLQKRQISISQKSECKYILLEIIICK